MLGPLDAIQTLFTELCRGDSAFPEGQGYLENEDKTLLMEVISINKLLVCPGKYILYNEPY